MLCFAPISMNRSMGNGYTTTLLLEILAQRNFVADFIRLKLNFIQKQKNRFLSHPLVDLGVTYALVVDFLFIIIELISSLQLRRYKWKYVEVGVFRRDWVTQSANFRARRKGASPTNHYWCQ